MIPIHRGPYRGKGEDGQPDNRILYVTSVCQEGDRVVFTAFFDTCTFEGILRLGIGKKEDYTRVTFAEFVELVAHELEDPRIEWKRLEEQPKLADLVFTCRAGCEHAVNFPRKSLTTAEICAEITDQTGVPTTIENGAMTIDVGFHKVQTGIMVTDAAGPTSEDEA